MKLPAPKESEEQATLVQWWEFFSCANGIDIRLLFSIPNGANKSMHQAMKFKREGLRKGVPDLMLAYPANGFHGLFIEMKRIGQKARTEQDEYGKLLTRHGYITHVCAGSDAAIECIETYLK